ncbi:MAG: N-acetylmuramoyl-L-alanine amidase [Anoxybacillus mongoliensis]|nr:N-acetylmuramoyl-L-alanine amidase [Anoxybacillus mongoliensis]
MNGLFTLPQLKDIRHLLPTRSGQSYKKTTLQQKTHIIIHHSLTKTGSAFAFANYHVSKGWPGIGYHFVIEQDGTIHFCNDLETISYHVGNHNSYCIGICLTGDFRTQQPTNEQKQSLKALYKTLVSILPNYKDVKGHNELKGYEWKQCPCFNYLEVLNEKENVTVQIKEEVKQYTVQQGDTLWAISQKTGVSVKTLLRLNPHINPRTLQPGQQIIIEKQVNKTEVKPPSQSTNQPLKQQNPIEQLINKLPNKVLRYGDRGEDVRFLQQALNAINFKCGAEDGIFGQKTLDAVKRVNLMFSDGNKNDVYDEKTKNYIVSKLKEKIK